MRKIIKKIKMKKENVMAVLSGAVFMTVVDVNSVIILAKNVMEFAQAYQAQDSSTMNSALKGIVAGVMMAGISSVLGILGF